MPNENRKHFESRWIVASLAGGLLQLSGDCADRTRLAYGDTNKKIRLEALNPASLVEEKVTAWMTADNYARRISVYCVHNKIQYNTKIYNVHI